MDDAAAEFLLARGWTFKIRGVDMVWWLHPRYSSWAEFPTETALRIEHGRDM